MVTSSCELSLLPASAYHSKGLSGITMPFPQKPHPISQPPIRKPRPARSSWVIRESKTDSNPVSTGSQPQGTLKQRELNW